MEEDKRKELPPELPDAISRAYLRHHDYLVKYAQRRGFSKDAAEDLVQETFLRVCQDPKQLLASRNAHSWLLGVLKHRIAHLKNDLQHAEQLKAELQIHYTEQYEDQLPLRLTYGGIIPEKDLELLIMYGVEGYSYAELCAKFGMEEPACRKQIERARKRFRKADGED